MGNDNFNGGCGMCVIADCLSEGYQAYYHLKQFFREPERANIDCGHYTVCNRNAWKRGFNKALWTDKDRWIFLKRVNLNLKLQVTHGTISRNGKAT